MTTRTAAACGALAASTWIVTALLVPARVLPDRATPASNALDLVANMLLLVGLAGFAATGAAHGRLGRIGLALAFAGLGVFALASILAFGYPDIGEALHPVSVPLTGLGMLLTGIATIHTRQWTGWQRFAPLLCGIVPFAVELPGFIAFGDSLALNYFIASTWTAWLFLNVALWTTSPRVPVEPAYVTDQG